MHHRIETLDVSRSLTLLPNQSESRRSSSSDPRKFFQPNALADSAFVAQLLAVRLDAPVQRQRRREEPGVATHLYAGRQDLMTADMLGPIFSYSA
jgi:hypothetical protein